VRWEGKTLQVHRSRVLRSFSPAATKARALNVSAIMRDIAAACFERLLLLGAKQYRSKAGI